MNRRAKWNRRRKRKDRKEGGKTGEKRRAETGENEEGKKTNQMVFS
jgi:hypothetical protein